ncbi:hypothetical protein [Acetobacter okinawensis]
MEIPRRTICHNITAPLSLPRQQLGYLRGGEDGADILRHTGAR